MTGPPRTRRDIPARRHRLELAVPALLTALVVGGCWREDLESRKAAAIEAQAIEHGGDHQPFRPLTEPEKIEKLLDEVRHSDLVFIRNGRRMTAQETATRLQRRYERRGRKVLTARDFAGRFAASGPLSGKPYLVHYPDGREEYARDWMIEQLNEIEAPPGRFVERLGGPMADAPKTGPKEVPVPEAEPPSVEGAIDLIEQSGQLSFVAPREGELPTSYSGQDMAKMLRNKTTWLGADLTEVQPWIDGIATRSYRTYLPYEVHKPTGEVLPLATWLRAEFDLPDPPGTADPAIARLQANASAREDEDGVEAIP